ncbi:VOC family protein [Rubripirellula reticaptiva]|uniref:Glyoxalase-like domain protein n=1 Tax=Rubripirellula reticaptiva TaxID=2528013 RepID=A0A5C6FBW0_9BACT|nr:VOC family protein [Rubripirellula reticaptiva]TWU57111.1 Glyoxalase-like domain protein [Rubripirellula reticaptiva]
MKLSAVTLPTSCMAAAVRFYTHLGFALHRGGEQASFTTFQVSEQHVNLRLINPDAPTPVASLIIFAVDDVDVLYQSLVDKGLKPEFEPKDAEWGERYFHLRDPEGNELSFAQRIRRG